MRNLICAVALFIAAAGAFHTLISASLAAARQAQAASFSERFAPALKSFCCA